jgi:hypothetical protein
VEEGDRAVEEVWVWDDTLSIDAHSPRRGLLAKPSMTGRGEKLSAPDQYEHSGAFTDDSLLKQKGIGMRRESVGEIDEIFFGPDLVHDELGRVSLSDHGRPGRFRDDRKREVAQLPEDLLRPGRHNLLGCGDPQRACDLEYSLLV